MSKPIDIFCELTCLTEISKQYSGASLQRKWFKSADKRIIGQYLQKFIDYNRTNLRFLGIQPSLIGSDQNVSLLFRTSNFIGSIPLRASDTGKQIGDLVVMPRFTGHNRFEDYIEILTMLGNTISPEFLDSLPLVSGKNFRPPMYLQALNFVAALEVLITKSWRKFDSHESTSSQPSGQINWTKYITNEHRVENRLRYPVRRNVLNEFHNEYGQIRYVFDISRNELLSPNTPEKIKATVRSRLAFIEKKLYYHLPKQTNNISINSSDSPNLKHCKRQANEILKFNFIQSTAWRVDFADVFEKFIQYIFKEVAKETGGKVFTNFKFQTKNKRTYSWELKHIEPDAIYHKDSLIVMIDAKYKSNFYNKLSNSEMLKEEHRHDLHQILAYSSFSDLSSKYGFLCYPSSNLEIKNTTYVNTMNQVKSIVFICGIPLKKELIYDTKCLLINKIRELEHDINVN